MFVALFAPVCANLDIPLNSSENPWVSIVILSTIRPNNYTQRILDAYMH